MLSNFTKVKNIPVFVTSRYVIDSDKSKVYHYFTKEEASMKYLHMFFYILLIPTHTIISQEIIHLPEPQTDRGKSLMQTILLRESSRSYNTISLPLQELSNLLLLDMVLIGLFPKNVLLLLL